MRLAAGLRPNLLGSAPPDTIAGYRGLLLRKGKRRELEEEKTGEGQRGDDGRGILSVTDAETFRGPCVSNLQ